MSVEWTETAKTQVPATLGLKVLSHGTTRTFSSWSLEGAFRVTGTGRACRLSLSSPLLLLCRSIRGSLPPCSFHHRPKAASLTSQIVNRESQWYPKLKRNVSDREKGKYLASPKMRGKCLKNRMDHTVVFPKGKIRWLQWTHGSQLETCQRRAQRSQSAVDWNPKSNKMAPGLLADSHHDAVFRPGNIMSLSPGIVPRGKGGIKHKEENSGEMC